MKFSYFLIFLLYSLTLIQVFGKVSFRNILKKSKSVIKHAIMNKHSKVRKFAPPKPKSTTDTKAPDTKSDKDDKDSKSDKDGKDSKSVKEKDFKIITAPYTSKYLQEFGKGAGLSITGEVNDKDVSGCFTKTMKDSNKLLENDIVRQLESLNEKIQRLHRIVKPPMTLDSHLFCYKYNKKHLLMKLNEVLGTASISDYFNERDNEIIKERRVLLQGDKDKKKKKTNNKQDKEEFTNKIKELRGTYPIKKIHTLPYWNSHFNNFFEFNLDNIREIRNKLLEFLGSDFAIELKTFLTCTMKKKNKDSRSHQVIQKSFEKEELVLTGMTGFINVLVNSICNWDNYKEFVEHLDKAHKQKDTEKKFSHYGRAFGEFVNALGRKPLDRN